MDTVDFRYAKISDCSMRKVEVTYGDFYFCNFKGCSAFQDSEFRKCSFTNAVFENAVIRWGSIKGILQDDIKEYRKVVNPGSKWYRRNPCGTLVVPPNDEGIRGEAIEMYKQLSGIYAGKGLNKDSNAAYGEMKKKELRLSWENLKGKGLIKDSNEAFSKEEKREFVNDKKGLQLFWENAKESVFGLLLFLVLLGFLFCKLSEYGYINCKVIFSCLGVFALYKLYDSIKDKIKMVPRYIWQKIKDVWGMILGLFSFLMGYGYRWTFAMFWYALLIIIGAYKFCNENIENVKSLCNCACDCSKTAEIAYKGLTYSVYNSVGSYVEEYVCVVGSVWANIQTILSFLLIGYLGFIFANKMRNNL